MALTVVAAAAMVACSRRGPDPCEPATFNEQACQAAVRNGGYYWQGSWYGLYYSHPYPYYYDSYHRYAASGGVVTATPGQSYGRPAGAPERGGFGSSGAAHSSGGEAAGE